jgi:hypothetical protein
MRSKLNQIDSVQFISLQNKKIENLIWEFVTTKKLFVLNSMYDSN